MSNNLDITLVDANQDQKEITMNDAIGAFDGVMTDILDVNLSAGDVTLTELQMKRYLMYRMTSVTTAGRVLTLPVARRFIMIRTGANNTQDITVACGPTSITVVPNTTAFFWMSGATGGLAAVGVNGLSNETIDGVFSTDITIEKSSPSLKLIKPLSGTASFIDSFTGLLRRWIFSFGDDSPESGSNSGSDVGLYAYDDAGNYLHAVFVVSRATGVTNFLIPPTIQSKPILIFDLGTFISGKPTASEDVIRYVATRAISFADDFASSQAKARVAATGSTVFDVQKNGSSVGSITFAAAGTTGTFATTGTTVALAAGDTLDLIAPVTPDATLEDISITFAGTR